MKSQQVVSQQEQMRCERIALDTASAFWSYIHVLCVQCTQMNLQINVFAYTQNIQVAD